ncbi:protein GOLM2 isoform X4 [Pseudoliparis swirei]|uniref:protein GOLM2 isoform X4 n=1 Tax=Pseudoliparis swirei TaxID=2059687 RepID=UPI0024BEE31D|nr:protein GOLM2 isoform X4 [Pseudoliparis swirei]
MVGFGANRRGGRIPSFILIFLMLIIAILSFNYWTVTSKHGRLLDELAEVQAQVKRTDAARSRLEKRNSELMVQVDMHRKQIDQKDGEYTVMEGKLQAREAIIKKCSDEKMKAQGDVTAHMTEFQRLKEQLKEMKQEFIKQEEQLREVKKNSTTLDRKLEYESLQCGRQIAQLKEEYEETKKTLEEEASKLRQSVMDGQKGAVAGLHAEGAAGVDLVGERHTVATRQHDSPDSKEMGKPGSDAGMPGIEDSEVGKIEEVQFALKKPAITQKHNEVPDAVVGAGAGPGPGPGVGAADGPGGQGLSLDQPGLQQDRVEGQAVVVAPPGINKQAGKPMVFEEDNKAGMKADELGEQQRQIQAPDHVKGDRDHLKAIPLPPNPAQVPNPIQPRRAEDQIQAKPVRHRQNDDDRDMQGDRAVDYGKRHQAIDIL